MSTVAGTALLAGFFAGIAAVVVTRAIERLGGTVGGVLATLPTTIVPASLGLAFGVASSEKLRSEMFAVPIGMLINSVYLLQWRYWPSKLPPEWPLRSRLVAMICISLAAWASLSIFAVVLQVQIFDNSLPLIEISGLLCFAVHVGVGLRSCINPIAAPSGSREVTSVMLIARGVMASIAIVISVLLSNTNWIVSGLAATFPAIFTTVMVGLWVSQGECVPLGAVGPMMLGGTSVGAYAMLFALLWSSLGSVGACLISWPLAAGCCSVPAALFLRWRRDVAAAARCADEPQSPAELKSEAAQEQLQDKQTAEDTVE